VLCPELGGAFEEITRGLQVKITGNYFLGLAGTRGYTLMAKSSASVRGGELFDIPYA
jgi:hypothetical protein